MTDAPQASASLPRFCFVVCDHGVGTYATSAAIAIGSLRHFHPACAITVLVDPATRRWLGQSRHALLEAEAEVRECQAGDRPAARASRFLKTRLRQLVDGPCMFVDGDMIAVRPLRSEELAPGAAIAAALDCSLEGPTPHFAWWTWPVFRHLRCRVPTRRYYNSGAVIYAETPAARALAETWHELWLRCEKLGQLLDQPALNAAIALRGTPVRRLSTRYNALVGFNPWHARRAVLVHACCSLGEKSMPGSLLAYLLSLADAQGRLPPGVLAAQLAKGAAWMRRPAPGRFLAAAPGIGHLRTAGTCARDMLRTVVRGHLDLYPP